MPATWVTPVRCTASGLRCMANGGWSMPWLETVAVEQREAFLRDRGVRVYSVTELCARYGISRKTGYKWLSRFVEGGRLALRDRSRAPLRCPHRIPAASAELICTARRAHPTWGPAKLLDWLAARHPGFMRPAVSTAGGLLPRRGPLEKNRPRPPPVPPRGGPRRP